MPDNRPTRKGTSLAWMLRFAITDLRSRISALKVFLACLVLGVTLVAATASLYRVVEESLLADTRALLGGRCGAGYRRSIARQRAGVD